MGGLDVECGGVGVDGVIDSAGALERESEVEAWLGVVGHESPGGLERDGCVIEHAALEEENAEVVVCATAEEVGGEGLAEQALGRVGVRGDRGVGPIAAFLGEDAVSGCGRCGRVDGVVARGTRMRSRQRMRR